MEQRCDITLIRSDIKYRYMGEIRIVDQLRLDQKYGIGSGADVQSSAGIRVAVHLATL